MLARANNLAVSELRTMIGELGRPVLGLPVGAEVTQGGGVRIPAEAWKALQERVADADKRREIDVAKAAGAKEAVESLQKRTVFVLTVLGAIFTFLGWLATKLLHL